MMRMVAAVGLGAVVPACVVAAPTRQTALAPYVVERSAVLHLAGPADADYSIMVAWPEGDPPASGWPVLYVLDGEDNFAIFALTARRLARGGERRGMAPGIVVGIGAGPLARRVHDYTPPVPGYRIPTGRPAAGLETGGSEAFLDFLQTRVMPAVRARWTVDSSRETLAGHSFGGALALHALLTRPGLFDRTVAVSPSFWFGDGLLAREAAAGQQHTHGPLLILTGGEERGAAQAARDFLTVVDGPSGSDRDGRAVDLPGQSHGTTMLAALPQVLSAAFGKEPRQ